MSTIQSFFEEKINTGLGKGLSDRRKSAQEAFKSHGIPTVKHEDWKYTNLKKISNETFEVLSEAPTPSFKAEGLLGYGSLKLCFINGNFSKEHSSDFSDAKIKVMDFQMALETMPELLEAHYGKYTANNEESLSALNVAIANAGSVIYVADNQTFETPIVIQNVLDLKSQASAINVHHLIVMGKNSEAKVVEIYQSEGDKICFENVVTEIVVNADARMDYYKIQNQGDNVHHVGTTQVWQDQKSYFYAATITIDGGFIRNNLNIVLDGEHIESHMFGLYIPSGSQHIDNHTLVDHRKPNCESNELYKGVLSDKSTGVFNGKIFVREDAQKTNAYQNCRNVITSDSAVMNTKPQLEIWADDVKCSHGTTTGQLNDEVIFYMQSRGIPKAEAIKLQLVAFAEDVVSQLKIQDLKVILEKLIEQKLNWE
jgi:Fe-S cluster assembly protein SufD